MENTVEVVNERAEEFLLKIGNLRYFLRKVKDLIGIQPI